MTDQSIKLEELLLKYKNQHMTRELKLQLYKEMQPFVQGNFLDQHMQRQVVTDTENKLLHFVYKAKTPLGKLLISIIGEGKPEI